MPTFLLGKQEREPPDFVTRPAPGPYYQLVVGGLVMLLTTASSALAIDCQSKADAASQLVCSNEQLVAAYGKMQSAYAKLLRQAPDDEIRAMLQMSQKRWHAALDLASDMLGSGNQVPDGEESEEEADQERTPQVITMNNLQARVEDLSSVENDGTPVLIAKALRQRHFAAKFSGGTFSGFDTSCNFLPPGYGYACFSTQHHQNGSRICSQQEYWASGSGYENRFVADVVHGEPRLVASCTFNGNDTSCLGDGGDPKRWNVHPAPRKGLYSTRPLPKLDAEIDDSSQGWLETCLTDPSFPTADPTRSGEAN